MAESRVLFDDKTGVYEEGSFSGAIIVRMDDMFDSIVVSDNVELHGGSFRVNGGLNLGFEGKEAFSREVDLDLEVVGTNPRHIDYIVLVGEDIIQQFDEGSFSHAFPYTISFLHTAGVLSVSREHTVDHLDFVRGEILARPVARFYKDDMVTFADRLVIDQQGDPVFYDSFSIRRNGAGLVVDYDPIFAINDIHLQYLLVIGSETLRK
ncbi:MAG: hypothetical protein ACTSU5_07155 [Promethearchaeota archaeon]